MKKFMITLGDLGGIGPDIALKYAAKHGLHDAVIVADQAMLIARAQHLGFGVTLVSDTCFKVADHLIHILPLSYPHEVKIGTPDLHYAAYNLAALERAVDGCLSGEYQGLLTGPINKALMNEAGIPFTGHTEWIAHRARVAKVVMMLLSGERRVALCTTHLALKAVPDAITQDLINEIVTITHHDLKKYFSLVDPKIAVTGLNPHAGDEGHFGREEIDVIMPAIQALQQKRMQVSGPFAADTLFQPLFWDQYDAVVAMYHDQGLSPIKALHFGDTVNMTLGLPFIRVSVDHGTAYDKAGTHAADESSFAAAMSLLRSI